LGRILRRLWDRNRDRTDRATGKDRMEPRNGRPGMTRADAIRVLTEVEE
jgi:hypothetical protein